MRSFQKQRNRSGSCCLCLTCQLSKMLLECLGYSYQDDLYISQSDFVTKTKLEKKIFISWDLTNQFIFAIFKFHLKYQRRLFFMN